jgi:peptide subunit release factor 1 (eRF1)
MSEQQQANEAEKNIEMWKVKKLIKRLTQARGNGTSMISLIIRTFPSTCSCQHRLPTPTTIISQVLTRPHSPQGSNLPSRKDVG